MSELEYHTGQSGWRFRYPSNLQVRSRESAKGFDVSLSDLTESANFFGFKIVLHSRRLAKNESRADGIAALERRLGSGAAKEDFVEVSRRSGQLAGFEADEVTWEYTLNAGRVEYTDPNGESQSAGDEPIALRVRALIADDKTHFFAAWLIADRKRIDELEAEFGRVLATASRR